MNMSSKAHQQQQQQEEEEEKERKQKEPTTSAPTEAAVGGGGGKETTSIIENHDATVSKLLSKLTSKSVFQKLHRFIKAQDEARVTIKTAWSELEFGKKTSHWIWYICPQFLDPGRSSVNNSTFQIHGQQEAISFLLHPDLCERQCKTFSIIRRKIERDKVDPNDLMSGAIDTKKLHHSSSTFFLAAESLLEANSKMENSFAKKLQEKEGEKKEEEEEEAGSGGERWARILQLKDDLETIVKVIQENPYKTAKLPLAFHDPVIQEKWDKGPDWKKI